MKVTPQQVTDLLASVPREVLLKALCPEYEGDRAPCPKCQIRRWREATPPREVACGSERESFERAVTAGPRAYFVGPDEWRCHVCGPLGVRSDVERLVQHDRGALARFLVLVEELLHAG